MDHGCYFFILFIAIIVWTVCVAPLSSYPSYHKHTCNITRIEYPTQLPTINNTQGWEKCDCGKYCKAWTTCIKLYSSIKPNLLIQSEFDENEKCTFVDDKCSNGEDLRYAVDKLSSVQYILEKYENNVVTCYYNEDITTIFLDKDYNDLLIILPSIFLGLIIIIGLFIYYFDKKKDIVKESIEFNNKLEEGKNNTNIVHSI